MILTKKEADKILGFKGDNLNISLDLGLSLTSICIKEGFVCIEEQKIPLPEFSKIKEESCYIAEDNHLQKLAFFSDETNLYYKLVPTSDWPTITLSSTPMHRHSLISPKKDSILKIREISPVKGRVLDTCCGLGYTAILSSKEAEMVYTFERDKNMLHMAGLNPYSKELFDNRKIKIFEEDVFDGIKKFDNCFFDRIIHDPPTFKYAPLLYSGEFYSELFRVLKNNGIIYHYSPSPGKMTKNNSFYKGIIRRLRERGFRKAEYRPVSSGVRAVK